MDMTNGTPRSELPGEPADWDRLARYLSGESPAEEADAVRRWLAADPAREQLLAELDRATTRLAFKAPADLDVEAALRSVTARMDPPRLHALPTSRTPNRSRWLASTWHSAAARIAAALVLLLGATLLFRQLAERGGGSQAALVHAQTFVTAVGERDSLRLPDGSLVMLGPQSELKVAAEYKEGVRTVELRGEALFQVRHDEAHPFVVRAGDAAIRDLGTTFTVRTDGEGVKVVVTEGTVRLSVVGARADAGAVLSPGDRGLFEPGGRIVAQRAAATEDDLAWTRGNLVFRDTPLPQVAADLRRWYGIELRIADPSLQNRHLTASFAGEPAEQVLDVMALALGAEIQVRGDTAIVTGTRR